jgi:phage terminase large subunit-like protein
LIANSLRLKREAAKRLRENRLATFRPYTKQRDFFAAGATHRERLLMAGNQLGKTVAGAAEVAMHVTGLYPEWWGGRRFDRPTRWWCASVTGDATRDNVQAKLIGPPEQEDDYGTGFIPRARLLDFKRAIGTPNLLDNATVKHVSGGISTIGFKAYSQGREKWQGPTLDGLWLDEEPPIDIYMEGLTRTNAVADSLVFLTFTPLLGMSTVVRMFLDEAGAT